MPEKVVPGPVSEDRCIREAVCIHTKKIFDSCKEKDIALLIYIYSRRIFSSIFYLCIDNYIFYDIMGS